MTPARTSHLLHLLIIFSCLVAGCSMDAGSGSFQDLPDRATVTNAIDGDTLRISLSDGRTETLRILGIDTPEMTREGNDPAKFGGIADREILSLWGEEASSFTRDLLSGQVVMITYDRDAGTRDAYGRLLATITRPDGTDHGEALVWQGLARVYTQETFSAKGRYLAAEREARDAHRGIWSGKEPVHNGEGQVVIAGVHYNAAGDDNDNLNDEYITIRNRGSLPADLSGWQVRDSDGFVYPFPEISLMPGETLTLATGSGNSSAGVLSMASSVPVLNNDGDTVTLVDRQGTPVSSYSWG